MRTHAIHQIIDKCLRSLDIKGIRPLQIRNIEGCYDFRSTARSLAKPAAATSVVSSESGIGSPRSQRGATSISQGVPLLTCSIHQHLGLQGFGGSGWSGSRQSEDVMGGGGWRCFKMCVSLPPTIVLVRVGGWVMWVGNDIRELFGLGGWWVTSELQLPHSGLFSSCPRPRHVAQAMHPGPNACTSQAIWGLSSAALRIFRIL